MAAAAAAGGSIAISSFPSTSSYFSHTTNNKAKLIALLTTSSYHSLRMQAVGKLGAASRHRIACSAVQESLTPSVATEAKEATEEKTTAAAGPAKPKPPTKAPAKPLPQLMEEDVIPSLKSTLEAQQDIAQLELSFQDNIRLEGSFLKKGNPYFFWAFFPDGLAGPKGFSLSSYGTGVSTVEPFLVDEKKITAKHIVFWVQKRLAAQGIIPVWRD